MKNVFIQKSFVILTLCTTMFTLPTTLYATGGKPIHPEHEEKVRKEQEQKRKEIHEKITKIEIADPYLSARHTTEKVMSQIPHQLLEMYDDVSGKIKIVEGDLSKNSELKKVNWNHEQDIHGKKSERYVYVQTGDHPTLFIQATEEYTLDSEKDLRVYYAIGQTLARDVFGKLSESDMELTAVINEIRKKDADGEGLLFPSKLQAHTGPFTYEFVLKNRKVVQDVLARGFAYYLEPHHRKLLETYAPEMLKYIEKLTKKDLATFKRERAISWGREQYAKWERSLTSSERDWIYRYSQGEYKDMNAYLRFTKGHLGSNETQDVRIQVLDGALAKAKTPSDITVYRRVAESAFDLPLGELRKQGKLNLDNVQAFANKLVNTTKKEHAFMSTSLIEKPSVEKAASVELFPILLQIKVPRGTNAAFISDVSAHPKEVEMLFQRGYSLTFTGLSTEIGQEGERDFIRVYATLVKET